MLNFYFQSRRLSLLQGKIQEHAVCALSVSRLSYCRRAAVPLHAPEFKIEIPTQFALHHKRSNVCSYFQPPPIPPYAVLYSKTCLKRNLAKTGNFLHMEFIWSQEQAEKSCEVTYLL
jgi:hypothetical protein